MSKFAQKFRRVYPVYKLDERGVIVKDGEIDVQERVNSCYDETLYRRLEVYFEGSSPNVALHEGIEEDCENFSAGCKADRVMVAKEKISAYRLAYNFDDAVTDEEVLETIRSMASKELVRSNVSKNSDESEVNDNEEVATEKSE